MTRYTTASDFQNKGPAVADLEGRLLAIRPAEINREARSKFNDSETKTAVFGDVWAIRDDGTVEELGRTAFYQQVLADVLAKVGMGNWLVGRVHRPGTAWLFKDPEPGDAPAIEIAMATLDPEPDDEDPAAQTMRPEQTEPEPEEPF